MKKMKQQAAYWTQKTHLLREDEFICSECGYISVLLELSVKISPFNYIFGVSRG